MMNQKYKEVKHFAQRHSAGKKQSHSLNPRKYGFRICNKLPSNKVLLGGEAGNVHNHINDHKIHFVLNIKLMLHTVDASEVWSWEPMLWVATCLSYRTSRSQIPNPDFQKERGFTNVIT